VPREAVAAASHRDDQLVVSGEFDRADHVLFGHAHCDESWSTVDVVIPHATDRIVARVVGRMTSPASDCLNLAIGPSSNAVAGLPGASMTIFSVTLLELLASISPNSES
jgi:hypothetical protein